MLSATPVNNRFYDLRNQLALAYEGNSDAWKEKLGTDRSVEEIFRRAQKVFNDWSERDVAQRSTDQLMRMLDFDFFEILDAVTIARSRRHIEKYYNVGEVGEISRTSAAGLSAPAPYRFDGRGDIQRYLRDAPEPDPEHLCPLQLHPAQPHGEGTPTSTTRERTA